MRDWLTSPASGWDRGGDVPPPALPEDVVARTREAYLEAYRRLTGSPLRSRLSASRAHVVRRQDVERAGGR